MDKVERRRAGISFSGRNLDDAEDQSDPESSSTTEDEPLLTNPNEHDFSGSLKKAADHNDNDDTHIGEFNTEAVQSTTTGTNKSVINGTGVGEDVSAKTKAEGDADVVVMQADVGVQLDDNFPEEDRSHRPSVPAQEKHQNENEAPQVSGQGGVVAVDLEAEAGIALSDVDEEEETNEVGFGTTAMKPELRQEELSVHQDEEEPAVIQHAFAEIEAVAEPAEPIIPVAAAQIIPTQEPIIQLTVAFDEEDQQHSSDSAHGHRLLGQTVAIDEGEDTEDTRRTTRATTDKRKLTWTGRTCVVFVMVVFVIGLVVVVGTMMLSVPTKRSVPTPQDTGPPSSAPLKVFPHQWAIEEFGMPDAFDGTTYPWSKFGSLDECQAYCEDISGGAYAALAFVSEAPFYYNFSEEHYENASDYPVVVPFEGGEPDCFCFTEMVCLWDCYSFGNNGTVLSMSERPPSCSLQDDWVDDAIFFNFTNSTDDAFYYGDDNWFYDNTTEASVFDKEIAAPGSGSDVFEP